MAEPYRKPPKDGVTLGAIKNDFTQTLSKLPALEKKAVRLDAPPSLASVLGTAETESLPTAPVALASAAAFKNIILAWQLPAGLAPRTWEIYEGTSSSFTPDTTNGTNRILTTSQNVISLKKDTSATTWYYKVYALNYRGERSSTYTAFGPYVMAGATNADIQSIAATKITAGELGADVVVTSELVADQITSGTLSAIDITGVTITGSVFDTGGTKVASKIYSKVDGIYNYGIMEWRRTSNDTLLGSIDVMESSDGANDGFLHLWANDTIEIFSGANYDGAIMLSGSFIGIAGGSDGLTPCDLNIRGTVSVVGDLRHEGTGDFILYRGGKEAKLRYDSTAKRLAIYADGAWRTVVSWT